MVFHLGCGRYRRTSDRNWYWHLHLWRQSIASDHVRLNGCKQSEFERFVRGLQVHLRESEQGLSATPFSATADRTLLITDIIEQNRRYEKVAQQNDSHGLARVLRAFDLVLVQLAAEDITPEEAEALQAKLLFELNVVLTKLSRDTSDEALSI